MERNYKPVGILLREEQPFLAEYLLPVGKMRVIFDGLTMYDLFNTAGKEELPPWLGDCMQSQLGEVVLSTRKWQVNERHLRTRPDKILFLVRPNPKIIINNKKHIII